MGVDYAVIKHCSDDEEGSLGVDYSKYEEMYEDLAKAEKMSNKTTKVIVKWSKILMVFLNIHKCGDQILLQIQERLSSTFEDVF